MYINFSQRRRGFTLIEILVVIGIIVLLSAILFPVFSRARESARSKSCLSNLKQLGLAFQQYTKDAGRRYPGAAPYQKWGNGGHWVGGTTDAGLAENVYPYDLKTSNHANVEAGSIFPYVRSVSVFSCPSNKYRDEKKVTYSMNCAIGGMHDVRMRVPSDIILLVDESHNNDGFFYTGSTNSTDAITNVHNGAGNLLFCDGHVKSFPRAKFPLVSSKANADDEITDGQNAAAQALKTSKTGAPRFYDSGFGKQGFYSTSNIFGSCAAPDAGP